MWISGELKNVNIPYIEMVRNAYELAIKNLMNYSMIFIGGGNTFKLLNDLKASGTFAKIKEYLDDGGVAFGGSAGAIIFGESFRSLITYIIGGAENDEYRYSWFGNYNNYWIIVYCYIFSFTNGARFIFHCWI